MKPAAPSFTLTQWVAAYLEDCRVRHMSPRTLRTAESNLVSFIHWANLRELEDTAFITRAILERYQRHLFYYRKPANPVREHREDIRKEDASNGQTKGDGDPLAVTTQIQRLRHVKMFFQWLAKRDHLPTNPAADIKTPKVPKTLPRDVISLEQAEKVLGLPDVTTVLGLRDRAVLELLYATGLRRFEASGLSVYDIDMKQLSVMVRLGKGNKDRLLPITKRAADWIERYVRESRTQLAQRGPAGTDRLFLCKRGKPMTENTLGLVAARHLKKAQIPGKKLSAHSLRHSMATGILDNGADIRHVQEMLGHADLRSTQIYTHVSLRKLREVYGRTHPTNQVAQASACGLDAGASDASG